MWNHRVESVNDYLAKYGIKVKPSKNLPPENSLRSVIIRLLTKTQD